MKNKKLNSSYYSSTHFLFNTILFIGKLAHVDLDDRALDALKEFPVEGAVNVLTQFLESNLEHVSNKSAYLCGVMKTYRQKSRAGTTSGALSGGPVIKAPDEEKIKVSINIFIESYILYK